MRKLRDSNAELAVLDARVKGLKAKKVQQLGELVIATGADRLGIDELAGALIVIAETNEAAKREIWARRGRDYFQGSECKSSTETQGNAGQLPPPLGNAPPA